MKIEAIQYAKPLVSIIACLLLAMEAGAQEDIIGFQEIESTPSESILYGESEPSVLSASGLDQTAWTSFDGGPQANVAACGDCCEVCGGGYCRPHDWYFGTGMRIMMRSRPRMRFLSLDEIVIPDVSDPADPLFNPSGFRAFGRLSTRSVGFDVSGGMDATIKKYLGRDESNRDHFAELRFWGLNRWSADREVYGLHRITDTTSVPGSTLMYGSLFTPFVTTHDVLGRTGGFNRADTHWIQSISRVNNIELNARVVPRGRQDHLVLHPNGHWKRECQDGDYLSWLYGIRYINLDEHFNMHSTGNVVVDGTPNSTMGDYDIVSNNNMLGFTIGVDWMWRKCRFEYGVETKASPMINFADQESRVIIYAPGDPLASTTGAGTRGRDRAEAAFYGDVSLLASYKVRKDFKVKAQYSFIWMTGLAIASEQLTYQLDSAPHLNSNGHYYDSGLTLSAEWIR